MTIYTLHPSWDRPPLSLNDRDHRMKVATVTAEIRAEVYRLAVEAKIPPMPRISVRMVWTVPTKGKRDAENPVLTYKAVCDALAAPTVHKRGISPGALIVPDDTPEFMVKHMPEIRYVKGVKGVRIEIEEEA